LCRWYNYPPALFYAVKIALFENKDIVIASDSVQPAINAISCFVVCCGGWRHRSA